jgi:uncharacterized membrane protein YphA (DoxX/SURF4 family)
MSDSKRWSELAAGERGGVVAILVLRLALAGLFLSQLGWKLPPHFGCPEGEFRFTTAAPNGSLQRSTGLCDWIGIEAVFSHRERSFVGLSLRGLVRLNGWFVESVVMPHFGIFGWLIFGTEVAIVLSLASGTLARLGATLALLLSIQLLLGVGGTSDPATGLDETIWVYVAMIAVSLILVLRPSGRYLGVDAILRRRLRAVPDPSRAFERALLKLT